MDLGYSLEGSALAPFVTDNGASKENIFTIAYDEDKFTGFNFHMRTLHYLSQQTFKMGVAPWNGFAVLESTYNLFGSSDARAKGLLVGQQYAKDGSEIVDDVAGAKGNLSNDFALFRLADFKLLKAEALVRLNGSGSGDALVNEIKLRAGAPTTGNYSLQDILDERGRELLWEGTRRQDLIRFGKFNASWWQKNTFTLRTFNKYFSFQAALRLILGISCFSDFSFFNKFSAIFKSTE